MNSMATTWKRLRAQGEGALMPYLTAGFPSREASLPLLMSLAEGGADLIELGIPFSDPVADGPTVREAGNVSLGHGVSFRWCLDLVGEARHAGLAAPVLLMGYCNSFVAYGVARSAHASAEVGIDGWIIPDLPVEHAGDWLNATRGHGVEIIPFVSLTTDSERARWALGAYGGFVYYIAVRGVTGARSQLSPELRGGIEKLRGLTTLPIAVGFGISTAAHVAEVVGVADGAIVGSALLERVRSATPARRCQAARSYIAELKRATRRQG